MYVFTYIFKDKTYLKSISYKNDKSLISRLHVVIYALFVIEKSMHMKNILINITYQEISNIRNSCTFKCKFFKNLNSIF